MDLFFLFSATMNSRAISLFRNVRRTHTSFSKIPCKLELRCLCWVLLNIPHIFFLNQRNSNRLKLVMRTSNDVSKEDKYHTGV